jgi:ABC-type multidrug transport system ATPase subunit
VVSSKALRLTGSVLYDDDFINDISLGDKAVYVSQDDLLFSYLTVKETLAFAAYFYSPVSTSRFDLNVKVLKVMNELNLTKSADTIIGSYTRRGISGGEYKRVLIGKELMKSPSVIFLDEPTSGLDAFQALAVMETMKTLASNGRIIVSVIHQPRSSIFQLFDRLLLLSEGQTMYFGPAREAVGYFERLGHSCPQHFNPADFFLDVLSLNLKTREAEEDTRARVEFLAKQWLDFSADDTFRSLLTARSQKEGDQRDEIDSCETLQLVNAAWSDPSLSASQKVSRWFGDFSCIAWRVFAETFRDYTFLAIRVASMFFFAVLLSLIFQRLGHSQRSIQDRTGLLYFVLINQSFTSLENVVNVFPYERKMVCGEIWSGAYKTSSYYMARVICELPVQFILPGESTNLANCQLI